MAGGDIIDEMYDMTGGDCTSVWGAEIVRGFRVGVKISKNMKNLEGSKDGF